MKKAILVLVAMIGMAGISRGDSWTQMASFPGIKRGDAFSFTINNKGFTGCGYDTSTTNVLKDFWEYDPSNNAWTQKADFGGMPRMLAIGFSIGNKGYAGTGVSFNPATCFQDFWEYDPSTNLWTQKANFSGGGRFGAAGFSINNNGYLFSGQSIDSSNYFVFINDFWQYNPSTDLWTLKTTFSNAGISNAASFVILGKGYVGTGFDSTINNLLQSFWVYDTLSNSWTQIADFPIRCCDARGLSICDKGYVVTGELSPQHCDSSLFEYNPITNQWIQKMNFPGLSRDEATCFSIGNKGYLGLGGDDGDILYSDFWQYTPDSACTTGIEELSNNKINIDFFPNPFTDKTTLTITGNPQNTVLNIFNIQGQKVKSLFIGNATEMVIDRDDLSEGIYFYELIDSNSKPIATGKMVVE
jgi:N-acetylneuraminic acid mutarotase